MSFGGDTYDSALDAERLSTEYEKVFQAMSDGGWHSLVEIAAKAQISLLALPGISARIRDMRKPFRGSHTVERRRRGDGKAGVWEYRLIVRPSMPEVQVELWNGAR